MALLSDYGGSFRFCSALQLTRLGPLTSRDVKNKELVKPKMSGPYHETVCTLLQVFSSTARYTAHSACFAYRFPLAGRFLCVFAQLGLNEPELFLAHLQQTDEGTQAREVPGQPAEGPLRRVHWMRQVLGRSQHGLPVPAGQLLCLSGKAPPRLHVSD